MAPTFVAGQQPADALASATALVRAGHYDAAIASIESALKARPTDVRLRTVEGIAYSLKGDDLEALRAFRAALAITPTYSGALRGEAEILVRSHDPAATNVLRHILAIDPKDATAREMLAGSLASQGDCTAAVAEFAQMEQAPLGAHPGSLQLYGQCLFSLDRYQEAIPVFEQLRALQPGDANATYDLALTQTRAGQRESAAATLAPSLDAATDIDTLLLASDVYEDTGDTPRAVALMRRAIVSDPLRADSYVRFAELCMAHESYAAGVDMVSAGLTRLPHDPALYLARGMMYGGMAAYDKAEEDFRTAEALDPQQGAGAYGVGLVQSQRNNPEAALTTARDALKIHPNDPQLNLLARLLTEGGALPKSREFAEAVQFSKEAVRLAPNAVAARDQLARVFMMTGDNALAIEQCRAALKVDPSDGNALYRLMRAARAVGDTSTAQIAAKQMAELHQRARDEESNRLRYKIVDTNRPDASDATHP